MTLLDLSSIGSLVSGVAVLMLLVYLSLQNRQMEKTGVRAGVRRTKTACPEARAGATWAYSRGKGRDDGETREICACGLHDPALR